jgi:hypothetical protein
VDNASIGSKLASLVHRPPFMSFSGSVSHQFNRPGIWTATAFQNGDDEVLSVTIVITGGESGSRPAGDNTVVAPDQVLIPVTGIDQGLLRGFAARFFIYFGFCLLGAGLLLHALSQRQKFEF